ncbi:spore cortex protein CoxA [Bacillus sp. CH30_1T]|uniref:YhcN/YlaJ family sporulation lipoprotein n=1 Tax=Bacillus sp. CH30_1T TaxID=2604836 RepID=UPI0011EDE3F6|nr:YhcN/YlaJ family sporulation lipoprotein [Bacillus sp. CH30_1T]KAA0563709.1 spore cortex protein CoxA [Bacillus sp. CH30_1T]
MNKRLFMVPLTAVMTLGLAACNSGEEEAQDRYTDSYEPLGFYSNEGHGGEKEDERDGPLTEMYDHSVGREGQDIRQKKRDFLQVKDENGNPQNPSRPLADYDENFMAQDGRASHGDANYHGHLDDNTRNAKRSYYTAYEGDLAEKIGDVTGKVENVSDVRAVAYGSDVLIAVELDDHSKIEETKTRVKKAVQPYLHGRTVSVVTDEGTFSRVRNIDNDLRDGGPREGINFDMHDMFKSVKHRNNE